MNAAQILGNGAVFEISRSHPKAGAFAGWIMKNGGAATISMITDAKIFAFFEDDGEPLTATQINTVREAFNAR
jgi:hypothetical protein